MDMWEKPGCHKPTMTEDGKHNKTHKDGDDLGMVTMAARVNPTFQSHAFVPLFLHDHSNIHGMMAYLLHPSMKS